MNIKEYINAYVMPDITVEEIEIEGRLCVSGPGSNEEDYDKEYD